jgi:hypothetical protein
VADFVFFCSGELSKGLVIAVRKEHGIITEAVFSAGLKCDGSFDFTLENLEDFSVESDGDRADEAGAAVFDAVELFEEFCDALRIRGGVA